MPNMKSLITNHNNKILNKKENTDNCNCRNKEQCPIKGKCQTEAIVYIASVSTDNSTKTYIGSCETSFKKRYYNHNKSFNNEKYRHETKLATHIWELKDENIEYNLTWEILAHSKPYSCGSRKCNLCLTEKMLIMKHSNEHNTNLLNFRSEILNKCRHTAKFKLKNTK